MTSHTESAPPPAPAAAPPARPSRLRDAVTGFLLLVTDVVVTAAFALFFLLRAWQHAGDSDAVRKIEGVTPPPPPPPAMDWTPTVTYGVLAVLVALTAFGCVRSGMPASACVQGAAAVLLLVVTLAQGSDDYGTAHPHPRSTPATYAPGPHVQGPCLSGSHLCH